MRATKKTAAAVICAGLVVAILFAYKQDRDLRLSLARDFSVSNQCDRALLEVTTLPKESGLAVGRAKIQLAKAQCQSMAERRALRKLETDLESTVSSECLAVTQEIEVLLDEQRYLGVPEKIQVGRDTCQSIAERALLAKQEEVLIEKERGPR
jgi:hypothetical protein